MTNDDGKDEVFPSEGILRQSEVSLPTLLSLVYHSIPECYHRLKKQHQPDFPSFHLLFIQPFCRVTSILPELLLVGLLAILITGLRVAVTSLASHWMEGLSLMPKYRQKLPECCWKLFYYGGVWILALYAHSCTAISTFNDPLSMWDDEWKFGGAPGSSERRIIGGIYAIQSAFYFHSIYATLFMDVWRSDSWVMFAHHFVALALLLLSYLENLTLAGILVLLLQDNSDALLEVTRLCVYLKRRSDGRFYRSLDLLSNSVLYTFAAVWVLCRLHWFSSKLLYATLYGGVYSVRRTPITFPLLGIMLVSILILNLFWFNFIARMTIRVWRTGQEPEDNREYDNEEERARSRKKD